MNREIKFRGKDCAGEWRYGNLEIKRKVTDEKTYESYRISGITTSGFTSMIDKETVGQFTGLHDKNGKEIYEGDIFKTPLKFVAVVERDAENGRFLGFTVDRKIVYVGREPAVEVIGNIHDNPELLKSE